MCYHGLCLACCLSASRMLGEQFCFSLPLHSDIPPQAPKQCSQQGLQPLRPRAKYSFLPF